MHMVMPKCESEAQIVSCQEKMQLHIKVLENQGEIVSFEPLSEGRK